MSRDVDAERSVEQQTLCSYRVPDNKTLALDFLPATVLSDVKQTRC